jgi:hypothetical protein
MRKEDAAGRILISMILLGLYLAVSAVVRIHG